MSGIISSAPPAYWATVAGLIGLAFGSFASVLAYRWPRGESIVRPRSHCTGCDRTLSPIELIPVVSWIAQRGRCRGCAASISWRYPAIELTSAALAAGAIVSFGVTWKGLAAAVLALALVPVVAIDLEHQLIPDVIVFPATAAGLAFAIAANPSRWWVPVVAALGAAGFLMLLWIFYPGGMGLGDVKLALLLGAVLGASVLPAMLIAFAAGATVGVGLMVRHGAAARKMAVPFGPFLAVGALAGLWWGPSILGWYADRLA